MTIRHALLAIASGSLVGTAAASGGLLGTRLARHLAGYKRALSLMFSGIAVGLYTIVISLTA